MKFYKHVDGYFIVDSQIIPQGICRLYFSDAYVKVISMQTDKNIIDNTPISSLQKENGSYYTDLSDLLSGVGDFFVKATLQIEGRVATLEERIATIEGGISFSVTKITDTDGVADNDGAITGTKEFSVPSDLSAILLLLDGGLERDDFSLDTTAHTITFSGDAPLAVNYIKILYIKS